MTQEIAPKQGIPERWQTEETLARLLELSRVLATTRNMEVALAQAVNSAVEIVSAADRCTLQWLDKDGETLRTVAFSDASDMQREVAPFRPGVGVAGHALASKQLINVPDVLEDERFVPGEPPLLFRSLLVAPLVVRDRALGTLSLSSEQIDAFSATDETLSRLMADQLAAALENANEFTARLHVEEALQLYTQRLRILHEIDQSILAARLPETIAVAAIRRIRQLIPCQRAMVLAIEKTGRIKLLAAESSGALELVTDVDIYHETLRQQTLKSGWIQGVEDLATLPHRSPLQQSLYAQGVRSYAIVPLFIQDLLVGTLNVESVDPRAFTPDHIAIATEVAASLAVAIRQVRLYEQAQQEIAERMRAEETLRRYAADLEARNDELDAFAHTVAHDLKNPVTAIIAYSQVLANERRSLQDETARQFLHVIAQNGRRLGTIIDDLLLLSSVRQAEEIEMKPLDMRQIVAEAQERLFYLIEECQGEIVLPDNWPLALGYGPWIEAVWANYVSNALKYGGEPPRVVLGATIQPDGWVRFWVRDNGAGLTPAEQARLFTPFERLRQMRVRGHGLGLSIVQRIVRKLGGQVGVESNGSEGEGSTFYFTLPGVSVGA